jgi:hypothetical protein
LVLARKRMKMYNLISNIQEAHFGQLGHTVREGTYLNNSIV